MAGYGTPQLEFSPYVAPYAGSATKELGALGETLNKRYDENLAAMDELDMLMNNVNVLNNDSHLKQKLLSDTRGQIKALAERGDWENSKNHVRQLAKRFTNDNVLKAAQTNYQKSVAFQDKVNEMKLRGENPIVFSDPAKFSTLDAEGKVRNFTSDVEKQLDYLKDQQEYFDQIQPNSYENSSSGYALNKKTGTWEQVGSGRAGSSITENRIIDTANKSLTSYLERPTGKQQMRVLIELQGYTPAQAREKIRQELINTGMERVFNKTQRSDSVTPIGGAEALNGGSKSSPNGSSPNLEQDPIDENLKNTLAGSVYEKLEKKDRAIVDGKTKSLEGAFWSSIANPIEGITGNIKTTKGFGNLDNNEKNFINKIGSQLGIKSTNGKYGEKDISKIRNYIKERINGGYANVYKSFKGEEINQEKNYLLNNADTRAIYDKETGKVYSFKELEEKNEDFKDAFDKGDIKVSGVYSLDNSYAEKTKNSKFKDPSHWVNPLKVVVKGKEYVFGAPYDERNKADMPIKLAAQKISKSGLWGVPLEIGKKGGTKAIVHPTGKGTYILVDKNNNPTTFEDGSQEVTADQLGSMAVKYGLDIEEL